MSRESSKSTVILIDIRNFTETFKNFQNSDSEKFLEFLDQYYANQLELAKGIDVHSYQSPIGDGILTIFMGDDHYKNGYAYVIASYRLLSKLCSLFTSNNPGTNISFGIGADSGNIWSIGPNNLSTYVGTVINRSSRIEGMTKMFANTTTAIGNSLYKYLMKDYYPTEYGEMEEKSYDDLINSNPEVVLISKQFMLQYIFDMPLKGIQSDASIFRLSNSLVQNDSLYWSVMEKLIDNRHVQVRKILNSIS